VVGKKINFKLSILISLFLSTSIFVFLHTESNTVVQKPAMAEYLMHVQGYKFLNQVYLPEKSVKMLKLDDYTYIDYDGPDGKVNLYIGYYLTADKAYAAHSPLVCYPSQGWEIARKAERKYLSIGSNQIQYEEIITSFGNKRELVLYWYQSDRFTTTNVYMNKIFIGYNKMTKKNEQHAFVRVSVPIHTTYKNANKTAIDFVRAFHKKLIEIMIKNNAV
jgi:EpsI family protein